MPNPTKPKRAARTSSSHGQMLTKVHGQHFLKDQKIIRKIIDAAKIKPGDTVLEIGPGKGALTLELVKYARKVIAIEFDPRQVVDLMKLIPHEYKSKIEVIHADFLSVDLHKYPFDLCVSNCPYNISSGICFKLLNHVKYITTADGTSRCVPLYRNATLMFQKEFAMRLVAQVGSKDWSRLAVNVQLLAETRHLFGVSRNCFSPPPKVDSSIITLKPRTDVPSELNFSEWEAFTKVLYSTKNKTLNGTLGITSIKKSLATNYITYCSMNSISLDDPEEKNPMKVAAIRVGHAIGAVMALPIGGEVGNEAAATTRPRMLSVEHLLWLLIQLNKRGIHFA